MKKKVLIAMFGLLVLTIVGVCFCNANSNKENIEVISLCEKNKEKVSLDYRVKAVKLETNDSTLLGSLYAVERLGDRLYVLNKRGVHIFDTSGRFIKGIEKGAGPGELEQPIAIKVSDKYNELLVVDNSNKVKIYDLEGNYLKEYLLPLFIDDVVRIDSNRLALHSGYFWKNQKYVVCFFDENKRKITEKFISTDDLPLGNLTVFLFNNFTQNGDDLYLCTPNSRVIYSIDTVRGVSPTYKMDFKSLEPSEDFVSKFKKASSFRKQAYKDGYIGFTNYFYKLDNVAFVGLAFQEYNCGLILENQSDKIHLATMSELFGLPKVKSLELPKSKFANSLIFSLEPSELFDEGDLDSVKVNLGESVLTVKVEDNPVIIFVEIK